MNTHDHYATTTTTSGARVPARWPSLSPAGVDTTGRRPQSPCRWGWAVFCLRLRRPQVEGRCCRSQTRPCNARLAGTASTMFTNYIAIELKCLAMLCIYIYRHSVPLTQYRNELTSSAGSHCQLRSPVWDDPAGAQALPQLIDAQPTPVVTTLTRGTFGGSSHRRALGRSLRHRCFWGRKGRVAGPRSAPCGSQL